MKKILFVFLLTFMLCGVVYAAGEPVPSGVNLGINVEIKENERDVFICKGCPKAKRLSVHVSGLPTGFSNSYVRFSSASTGATTCPDTFDFGDGDYVSKYIKVDETTIDPGYVAIPNRWVIDPGFDYVNVFYKLNDTCYYTSTAIHVDKKLPSVSERYVVKFEESAMYIGLNFPVSTESTYEGRVFHTKIGLISEELSKQLALTDKSSDTVAQVMEYAKSLAADKVFSSPDFADKNTLYEEGSSAGVSIVLNDLEVKKDLLYFVYTYTEGDACTGEGCVTPHYVEGINIVQGTRDGNGTLTDDVNFTAYMAAVDPGSDPDLPPQPDPGTDGPIDNPGTGMTVGIVGLLLFMVGMIVLSKKSKQKFYRI